MDDLKDGRCWRVLLFGILVMVLMIGDVGFLGFMGDEARGRGDGVVEDEVERSEIDSLVRAGGESGLEEHPWPMFQHDTRHTGYNPNAVYDNPGRLKWKIYLQSRIISSPVINRNGTIYVGAGYTGSTGLWAISSNGTALWRYSESGEVLASPCLDNEGNIYFVSGTTTWSYLTALNPNGTLKWRYPISRYSTSVYSSPIVDEDGVIYFGTVDSYLYAVYPNGTLKWKFKTGGTIWGAPALGDGGVIYVGSADGFLYAVNSNGTMRWRFHVGSRIVESPTVGSDGTIFFGSQQDCNLYAIWPNGTLRWKFKTGSAVQSSPAIDESRNVYFGSNDYYLYALYPNGTLKWRFRAGYTIESSPVIGGDGVIYVGSGDYFIYAIYPNGTLKWKFRTRWFVLGSPSLDERGNVLVGGYDGYVYCFGALPPEKPEDVGIRSGDGFTTITWKEPGDDGGAEIEGYRIYRRGEGPEENFSMIGEVGPDVFRYTDSDVENGKRYEYYVVAFNREGEGNRSEVVVGEPKGRPREPGGLRVLSVGKWYVELGWEEPESDGGYPLLGYRVYRKRISESKWKLIGSTEERSYNDTGVYKGGTYDYRVSAYNEFGESEYSEELRVKVAVPPGAPVNLRGEVGDGYVHIYWTEPPDDGGDEVVGYRVYRDGEVLVEVEGEEYNDTGVKNGQVYVYEVSALNGVGEGERSVGVSFRPMGLPGEPLNLSAEVEVVGEGAVKVVLRWEAPSDDGGGEIGSYRVYRDGELLLEVEGEGYEDSGVELGGRYVYAVSAVNDVGEGERSEEVEVEIPSLPGVPGNLSYDLEGGVVRIVWESAEGAEWYDVYLVIGEDNAWLGRANETEYRYGGVEEGRVYRFRVRGCNEVGKGEFSEVLEVYIPEGGRGGGNGDNVTDGEGEGGSSLLVAAVVAVVMAAVLFVLYFIFRKRKEGTGGEEGAEEERIT